jgi:hypothetical protein
MTVFDRERAVQLARRTLGMAAEALTALNPRITEGM